MDISSLYKLKNINIDIINKLACLLFRFTDLLYLLCYNFVYNFINDLIIKFYYVDGQILVFIGISHQYRFSFSVRRFSSDGITRSIF